MTGFRGFQLLVAAACGALAAACGQSAEPAADAEAGVVEKSGQPRVVVAVIDSGINPYHSFFNEDRPGLESRHYPRGAPPSSVTPEVLAEFGIDRDHVITLTRTGDAEADYAADAEQWAQVKAGEPYWFRGTNIIAVGRDASGRLILPDDDSEAEVHGNTTVASALAANPEAVIFFVEHDASADSNDIGSKDAHDVAFLHPAVDIVSTSYGLAASAPEPLAFFDSFESVVYRGKLHFASVGNTPAAAMGRGGAGPWWSIAISGSNDDRDEADKVSVVGQASGMQSYEGQTAETAHVTHDFVADAFQALPFCSLCETGTRSPFGTSLSTATAAGVASRIVLEARRRLGHAGGIGPPDGKPAMARGASVELTNWQIRRAMEEAAWVPSVSGWTPEGVFHGFTGPVNDAAPWVQVGWGELTTRPEKQVVERALARLGLGGEPPQKADGFCDYQTKVIEARHAYWDTVSPWAEANLPGNPVFTGEGADALDSDPFIYCGAE